MKLFISLILSVLPMACASAPRNSGCESTVEHVSIEYKGIQRLNAWDRENPFGSFAVSNKASKEIKLPLDSTYYPLIMHGQSVELQSRPVKSVMAWELDTVVLEEFHQPRKWLVVGPGDGTMFFVDMVGPVSDIERSNAREYRVSLKDTSGCQYFSQSFRINN
ncbi:MAG: hypothetical protein H0T88_11205 [Lysobacter sp.]|nr:hypothetical protein [Lysobacter sp.]